MNDPEKQEMTEDAIRIIVRQELRGLRSIFASVTVGLAVGVLVVLILTAVFGFCKFTSSNPSWEQITYHALNILVLAGLTAFLAKLVWGRDD